MNPAIVVFLFIVILVLLLIIINRIATVEVGGWTIKVGKLKIEIPSVQPFYFLKTWFIEPVENMIKNGINSITNSISSFSNSLANIGVPAELANALAFTIIFVLTLAILYVPYKLIGG